MRVEDFLRRSAALRPDKVALVAGTRRWTYADLDEASDRLAGALAARGFDRGERAIVLMDNSAEALIAMFGVLKAGGVFSPLNPSTKAQKVGYVLANCRAAAILTQDRLLPIAREAREMAPSVRLVVSAGGGDDTADTQDFGALIGEGRPAPTTPGITIDLSMLIYTSGSTGVPKGVMMTHQNVDAAATSITTYLENTPDDVILSCLPLSFDYGLYQALMAFKLGATLVLEKNFAFPQAVLSKIGPEGVTGLPLVPTMAALILQMRDLAPGAFPGLRYITNTAAALPVAHIERLRALFPSTTLYSMYGLTECKRCTWLPPAELDRRPGSVGIAIPGTEAYVVDADGRKVPPGVEGELVIRGPHVMKGYWEDEAATSRALKPGPFPWEKVLYTGDLFRTDEDGFLYFVGRKDDIIKSRGEKVSPKEIENVLYALPGIREAAVVGVPDAVLGQAIRAVVATEPGVALTAKDVLRHCAGRLEDYMVPKSVVFRDALPKTDTGKISRRQVEAEERETV